MRGMVMRLSEKPTTKTFLWFRLGLVGIFLLSLGLRFWGLGRFNTLVFDEVYYAKFANNYLTRTPFFDGHPPFSKYLIAIGIWIGNRLPIGQDTVNSATGSILSTWSYRWLNALTGSFIPLVIAAIAFELSRRRSYALVAALFAALDGLFLVESRYALNNVYLVIFGLLGQWFLLLALQFRKKWWIWLNLSGLFFGASASIKWNGLWFLLGAYILWGLAWSFRFIGSFRYSNQLIRRGDETPAAAFLPSPLHRLTQIHPIYFLFCLAIIPAVFYRLIWIPHIQLNPEFNFLEVQKQILSYHERVGSGMDIHPYCSTWYSWILMLRPVAYFYQVTNGLSEPLPTSGSTTTLGPGKVVYDVHAMGNPILWWLSAAAIVLVIWLLIENWSAIPSLASPRFSTVSLLKPQELWIALYLFVNYIGNLAPWMRVSRCVFLYHYMGSSVFASLALAWFVDRWLRDPRFRPIALWMICLITAAFIFWLPIYLGLPLSMQEYGFRMWLRSWI